MSNLNPRAFPLPHCGSEGMTLRDYFAAQAMQMKFGKSGSHIDLGDMARKCYAMADAMLAARAQ